MWKTLITVTAFITEAAVAAVLLMASVPAQAESLRCSSGTASEGDSAVSLVYKCGQPMLQGRYCAPVYAGNSPYPVPEPFASNYLACQPVDEWIYDRGPGNLVATVLLRSGKVTSIRYGRVPQ